MFKFFVILFIVKLYAHDKIFKCMKKKHGQGVHKAVKTLEHLKTNLWNFKLFKSENIVPTFAKVKVFLEYRNHKLKTRIAKIVTDAELQNKHREKIQLKKLIKQIGVELISVLGIILYSSLI